MREIIKKTTEIKTPETRGIDKLEERLHDKEGVEETKETEHTHREVARDHGGELADCFVTRCEQLDSLLQERRERLCSLEAIHDQLSPVELCELEGASAVDRYTRSLGVMEAPGTLVVTRSLL